MTDHRLSDADHAALARLVTEAAWRVDHGQSGTLHELFTPDATMTLGPTATTGRDEIAAWGTKRDSQVVTTRHAVTNFWFRPVGDDRAEGTTLMTVFMHNGAGTGPAHVVAVGDYIDRFERTDGTWRISSRTVSLALTAAE